MSLLIDPEARKLMLKYRGNPLGLADELIRICLNKTKTVFDVFLLLDDYSTLDVGCRFISRIDHKIFQRLVITNDGLAFCKALKRWLEDRFVTSRKPTACGENQILLGLLKLKGAIAQAHRLRNQTTRPQKLSNAEIKTYRLRAKKRYEKFNPNIIWELPQKGTGFTVYNRNDVRVDGLDQVGTKETIAAMIRVAREWYAKYPGTLLQYGDVSLPGGIDTSQHGTHNIGMAWDMRILSKSNARRPLRLSPATSDHPDYNRVATKEFIRLTRHLYSETTVFFNDSKIRKDIEFKKIVEYRKGHWDHLHVMPFRKGRE